MTFTAGARPDGSAIDIANSASASSSSINGKYSRARDRPQCCNTQAHHVKSSDTSRLHHVPYQIKLIERTSTSAWLAMSTVANGPERPRTVRCQRGNDITRVPFAIAWTASCRICIQRDPPSRVRIRARATLPPQLSDVAMCSRVRRQRNHGGFAIFTEGATVNLYHQHRRRETGSHRA